MAAGRTVFPVLAALLALAESAAAEPLGRLFFAPERRAALERQRQLNIRETETLEGATMTLNGVVVRSSGKRTVWINRQAQHDGATSTGVAVGLSAREPGRATLSANGESPADIRVGESINRATREKSGDLAGSRIGVGKPGSR